MPLQPVAEPLRIVGPRSTFRAVIGSLLSEFFRRYPRIQPDVQLDDRIGNWVEDRAHIGFRVGASATTAAGPRSRRGCGRSSTWQSIASATPASSC